MQAIKDGGIQALESTNGIHSPASDEPTIQDLERELPIVNDGQIPVGDLLSRVMQAIYAELAEMAET